MSRTHSHAHGNPGGARRDLVVVAGSAGSFEPLREIVAGLGGYRGTLLVVVHVPAGAPSVLPKLLERAGALPARHAADGDAIQPGSILVAPPDRHLLVEGDHVRLGIGPTENSTRPAADPLFRTAARAHSRRVVGVILSGALDDGTRGLAVVKERGGFAIVQRPDEARFRGMPKSAIENVDVDRVLAASEIAACLRALADEPKTSDGGDVEMKPPASEIDATTQAMALEDGVSGERRATLLSCPSCHGVLMRITHAGPLHFSCQIGHAYSPLALASAETDDARAGLDVAYRSLRERAMLGHMMAERARQGREALRAAKLTHRAQRLEANANRVQELYEMLAREDDAELASDAEDGDDAEVLMTLK